MDFKEFFENDFEDEWRKQSFLKRAGRSVLGRASYPRAQNSALSLPNRDHGNMHHYLDGLMGADWYNRLGIDSMLEKIKAAGGDAKEAKENIKNFMLKVSRGDFSEEMAGQILKRMLSHHLANAVRNRNSINQPNIGIPEPALEEIPF